MLRTLGNVQKRIKKSEEVTLFSHASKVRFAQCEEAVSFLLDGTNVSLSGVSGSGLTWVLETVEKLLHGRKINTKLVSAQNLDPALIGALDNKTVLLVDDLEQTTAEILAAITSFCDNGGTTMVATDVSHFDYPIHEAIKSFTNGQELPRWFIKLHRIVLNLFDDAAGREFAHKISPITLHTSLADTIVQLSHGRPGWTEALVEVAAEGFLQTFPFPQILMDETDVNRSESFREISRNVAFLSDEDTALAVAMTQISPLFMTGVETFIGVETFERLKTAGVMIETEQGSKIFTVPKIFEPILKPKVDSVVQLAAFTKIADALAFQDSMGVPLNENDTLFCAKYFTISNEFKNDDAAYLARKEIACRAISQMVSFGAVERARSLMLRVSAMNIQLAVLEKTRTLIAFGNRNAAFESLRELKQQTATEEESFVTKYYEFLINGAELSESDGFSFIERFLWALNQRSRLEEFGDFADLLRDDFFATDSVVHNFISAMLDLDKMSIGVQPETSWLNDPESVLRLPFGVATIFDDLLAMILLSQAMTALLAGLLASRLNDLLESSANLAAHSYHRVWLKHLAAAEEAMFVGDIPRGYVEWQQFMKHAPKLVPNRIMQIMQNLGDELKWFIERADFKHLPSSPDSLYIRRMILYITGTFERFKELPVPYTLGKEAVLTKIAIKNRKASMEQNPVELLRIGDLLFERKVWSRAAAAYKQARQIYLGRRATGNIVKCDEKLAALVRQSELELHWFDSSLLAEKEPVLLTDREKEVATLAAQGKTNKQIAESLECSVRTVETHVAAARAKLGAPTRADLKHFLADLAE